MGRPDHGTVSLCTAAATCDHKTGVEMDIEDIIKQAAEDSSIVVTILKLTCDVTLALTYHNLLLNT